jgi:hypothetical protein
VANSGQDGEKASDVERSPAKRSVVPALHSISVVVRTRHTYRSWPCAKKPIYYELEHLGQITLTELAVKSTICANDCVACYG